MFAVQDSALEPAARLHLRAAEVRAPACSPLGLARHFARRQPVMLIEGVGLGHGDPCSLVAAGEAVAFTSRGARAEARAPDTSSVLLAEDGDPLGGLMRLAASVGFEGPAVPAPLTSYLGFMAYDAVRRFEHLPARVHRASAVREWDGPEYEFFLPTFAVLFRGGRATARAVAWAEPELARARLDHLLARLVRPDPPIALPANGSSERSWPPRASFDQAEYVAAVKRAKEYILDGDIFQVVLSVRWDVPFGEPLLDTYARLVSVNPSPLQYCYLGPRFGVVGASPEPLVTADGERCAIRPLAGTRRRGVTEAEDQALEAELRASVKEQAEHRMLVDLARNDLGRVCTPGSVEVDQLMGVERYSHVMHLVSNVVGRLPGPEGLAPLLRASFPAGTMTGAPKIRAMEIIDELEPVRRGLYAGGVGLISPRAVQLFITIRGLVARAGVASLQAGAGIVHDSDPRAEYEECLAKLQATLGALRMGARQP